MNKYSFLCLNRSSDAAFTLLEVLVALIFLIVLAVGVLQSVIAIGNHYRAAQAQRNEVLRKWNESRRLRSSFVPIPALVETLAGSRPLYRHLIQPQVPGGVAWEVWLGEP